VVTTSLSHSEDRRFESGRAHLPFGVMPIAFQPIPVACFRRPCPRVEQAYISNSAASISDTYGSTTPVEGSIRQATCHGPSPQASVLGMRWSLPMPQEAVRKASCIALPTPVARRTEAGLTRLATLRGGASKIRAIALRERESTRPLLADFLREAPTKGVRTPFHAAPSPRVNPDQCGRPPGRSVEG
jgi:hypothetical protein